MYCTDKRLQVIMMPLQVHKLSLLIIYFVELCCY